MSSIKKFKKAFLNQVKCITINYVRMLEEILGFCLITLNVHESNELIKRNISSGIKRMKCE